MQINKSNVVSVYSGRDGRCCCGCSGIHRHSSISKNMPSYGVVSDRHVARVCNIMNKHVDELEYDNGHVALRLDGRLYIAYMEE